MIFTWLNDDELREIGWEEDHIRTGLVGQVAAFFFVKDKDDVYNVRRNFMHGTYDCEEDVTFRGEEWAALITTWI
ncbi:hypothetical protein [Yellowstone lake phycodnavirus 3]|uniref:hypothetical protein n=1 Tax=Yellowstone lake phycodnavirus 3 TaxID=1586715 RepID=UPI0006EB34B2|nr:hypothetical protein AR677_gp046 [Yellowstone lake phycodnavirus 3]BAT22545.1 hypothetical protein [Yellowstone lake phycodnavirus 3]